MSAAATLHHAHSMTQPGLLKRIGLLRLCAVFLALMVMAPLLVIALSWGTVQTDIWAHLAQTQLARLLGNTLVLVLGVGSSVLVLGVSLAWLTATCQFPGRKLFDVALMLPLAVPAYVMAFVMVGLLDIGRHRQIRRTTV